MTRAAIQLYTLRDVDRPFVEILQRVANAGFDGIEFTYHMTHSDVDRNAVVEMLNETNLDVAGAHVSIEALEDEFESTVETHQSLTTENIVVPYLDVEHFASTAAVNETAERLSRLDDALMDREMEFYYHNHDHEYVDLDRKTGFETFLDQTTFGIELDLGMALKAGDDPVARLRSLGDRSKLVYLRDYTVETGEAAPLGEGDLDLDGIADALQEVDTDWLIFEYEGEQPLDEIDDVAKAVKELC